MHPVQTKESNDERFKFDLGIRDLLIEWKSIFSKKYFQKDLFAGLSVASINLPLALAIALASGIDPATGLVTAIVASLVCTLFGSTTLSVSGPAIAMAVLIADVVQDHGLMDLLIVGFLCGIFQVLTGFLRLAKFIRFVPLPVLAGFTAGIGAIIFVGQLPAALGLPLPNQSHNLSVIAHVWELQHKVQWNSFYLTSSAILISFILTSFFPRLPAPLIALIIPSWVAAMLGLQMESIGNIPRSFPSVHLPSLPQGHILQTLWTAFVVFALASMETLLSSSAVAKLAKRKIYDPDQELIGQGLGNIASSLFGGIPVAGVFGRSALNVHAGAKTKRSVILNGFFLILSVGLFAPYLSQIPVAVLVGVLLSIALRMLHPRELIQIWRASQYEALIYLITFCVTIFADLILGIQAGVIAALMVSVVRLRKTTSHIYNTNNDGPLVLALDGDLSFLNSSKIESFRKKIDTLDSTRGIVFDLTHVVSLDVSSGRLLVDLFEQAKKQQILFAIQGASETLKNFLSAIDPNQEWLKHFAIKESDLFTILSGSQTYTSFDRLVYGVDRFRREISTSYSSIFRDLETGQQPHTLFITCCDSRINPNLITSTDPGELFILRNIGNVVPPFGNDNTPTEGAAIEYAVEVLGVKEIVICAHSECGAIKYFMNDQLLSPEIKSKTPSLTKWMDQVNRIKLRVPPKSTIRRAIELNAILQFENLKTYPAIHERLTTGTLGVHVWYYDIGKSELEEWDEDRNMFVNVGGSQKSLNQRIKAGVQIQVPIN